MKNLTNKSKNQYTYYCDRCKKEISYKDKTLNKIYVEQEYNKRKHVCDLCDRCFKSLERGIKGNGGTGDEYRRS